MSRLGRGSEQHFSGGAEESGPQQQLNRLRFFIEHVKRTVDRMEQAKTGAHHYTSQQLDMLEVRSDDWICLRLLYAAVCRDP